MSPLLPPERLREIRAREEDATPGPWELVEMGPDSTVHKISVRYCVDHEHSGKLWHNLIRLEDTAYAQHCSWDQRAKDAAFIAEARTAVPQLLAALETAEQERDALKAALGTALDYSAHKSWCAQWTHPSAGGPPCDCAFYEQVSTARALLSPTQPEGGGPPASLERKQ